MRLVKRFVTVGGRSVGIGIEELFWIGLHDIATARGTTTSKLIVAIDSERHGATLSSAIRIYVLDHFLERAQGLDDADDAPDRVAQTHAAGVMSDAPRPRWLN